MYDELGAHPELIAMGPTPIVPAPQTHKTNRVDSKQDRQDKRDTDAPAAKNPILPHNGREEISHFWPCMVRESTKRLEELFFSRAIMNII